MNLNLSVAASTLASVSCHSFRHVPTVSGWVRLLAGVWFEVVSCWTSGVWDSLEFVGRLQMKAVGARTVRIGCVAVTISLPAVLFSSGWVELVASGWFGVVSCWTCSVWELLEDVGRLQMGTVGARTLRVGCVAVTISLAVVLFSSGWVRLLASDWFRVVSCWTCGVW